MSHTKLIDNITLKVKSLQRSIDFYRRVLGFTVRSIDKKSARLSTSKTDYPLVNILEIDDVIPKPVRTTGLYHYAIRLPSDQAIADLLINILNHNWTIHGAADHTISKAIYFFDSDGNGIEIYSDRPREYWEWNDGEVSMSTNRLDIASLIQTASKKSNEKFLVHPDTVIGHVHLSVANLSEAE